MDQPLIFDKYEVLNRIAVAEWGDLPRAPARRGGFDRLVILKSLLPDLAEQPGFVEQFFDEARAAGHPQPPEHRLHLRGGRLKGIYYIAMEYIAGETLAVLLRASAGSPGRR